MISGVNMLQNITHQLFLLVPTAFQKIFIKYLLKYDLMCTYRE